MSQTCPRCKLMSPDEAIRCDCGYDFTTRRVEGSYLVANLVQKYGGARNTLARYSTHNIRVGWALAAVGGLSALTGSAWGALLLASGVGILVLGYRQRRLLRKAGAITGRQLADALDAEVLPKAVVRRMRGHDSEGRLQ